MGPVAMAFRREDVAERRVRSPQPHRLARLRELALSRWHLPLVALPRDARAAAVAAAAVAGVVGAAAAVPQAPRLTAR